MNVIRSAIIAFLVTCVPGFVLAQSTALRYKAPATPAHCDVKITVDSPIEKSTYQGRIAYEGTSDGANLALAYKGGLKESTEKKRSSSSSNRDPFGFPPRPPSLFELEQNRGPGSLRQTTAKLSLTPTGEILSLEGESQIPLPLGNLSLLVFETLPDEAKSTWSTTNGVLLGKPSKPAIGSPFNPFGRPAEPGSSSAGSETGTYTVKATSGSRVTIDKKYALNSPNTKPAFELSGGGPLIFDNQQGLFVSCNLNYDLKIKGENIEIRIPVTVEYKLMSAQDIAAADQQQREAAAKAAEAAVAAARAQFAGLSEKQISDLYQGAGGLVPPTGRIITSEMHLPKGLLIQNKWPTQDKWSPAKVVRELPDGQIEFESVETKKLFQRDRSTLFLAPDFVDQPHVSSAELASFRRQLGGSTPDTRPAPEFRTWQDASGKFSVEAKFLRVDGDHVVLHRKKDDREIKVPLKLLSPADQKLIAEQKNKGEANPFE